MADRYADRYQGRPTRAEDGRAPGQAPQAGESDPLAELARLIGQTDPFANLGRGGREPPPAPSYDDRYEAPGHDAPDENTSGHDTSYQDTSDQDHSDHDAPPEFDVKPSRPSWMQRVAQREAPQSYEEPVQATKTYNEPSFTEPSFRDAYPATPHSTVPQDPHYDDPRYAPSQHDAAYLQPHDHAYDQQQPDPSRYDDALYGVADGQDPNYDPHAVYPEDAYVQQGYDEEAAERVRPKRGGMMTVVVVAALAVVGTAGAYTYRTWHGSPRNGEAPIIKADPGPNKVVPPTQSADGSSKPIQDRVATAPGSERIVSREEQPVDPNTVKTGPRVVFPPLTQNPNPNPGGVTAPVIPASRQAPGATATSLVGDEPRRVRTLAIRPDQADAGPAAAAPIARQPVAAPTRAPAPATTATTSPPANAPMSLSPGAAPTRTASNNPAAAAPAAASTGGYVVQISSQRSEADAQASYRALQGKFPSVLGSRAPLIRRADLGEKGIYYRAMVGPFGTPDEASQFCGSLKTAGGQCVVQRN